MAPVKYGRNTGLCSRTMARGKNRSLPPGTMARNTGFTALKTPPLYKVDTLKGKVLNTFKKKWKP